VCHPARVADLPVELSAAQARVVGSLLEKQLTTPDAYPMTLNAVTTACNQTSNRDPVVQWTPQEVETTLLALKAKGLARVVHPGSGERATKYRQVLDEVLELDVPDRALLAALLLRGPQTPAELRTRTERLHPFGSPGEVEAALEALARRDPPLVGRVGRVAGQKEGRWTALLEPGAAERAATAPPPSDAPGPSRAGRVDELEARVAALEDRLAQLERALGD
jgi:uncharacterized protein YceH (UPF0502 family)